MKVGDAVQIHGQGPVGIVTSGIETREWYDRASAQWKTFKYHQVLMNGEIIQVDPFVLKHSSGKADGNW